MRFGANKSGPFLKVESTTQVRFVTARRATSLAPCFRLVEEDCLATKRDQGAG